MDITVFGSLMITYAVIQTLVFLLLLRFVDLYEREPISVVALMALWGAIGATSLSAIGNVAVQRALPARIDDAFGTAIYAPLVEEVAKGIALIAFVAISLWADGRFRIPYFAGVTDGIVYGAAVGLGFAFTEDILYLLLGAAEQGLRSGLIEFLSRRDFFGLSMFHHAIYTATFGAALGLASWARGRWARLALPAFGLMLAMTLHALNNGLVQLVLTARYGLDRTIAFLRGELVEPQMQASAEQAARLLNVFDYVLIMVFVAVVWMWLRYQRRVIREELAEEASSGLISQTELDLMPSYWKRSLWYWQLVRTGQWERWRVLRRVHNELVDLAFLKRRTKEPDATKIESARQLIAKLKAQKVVFF